MSDTPRTDSLCKAKGNDWTASEGDYIDLCEALERDLSARDAQLRAFSESTDAEIAALRDQLVGRTADVERLQANAERWQKLLVLLNDPVTYFYNDDGDRIEPEELTAAIDTAREK